jgi:small subunit ribosomal protein S19e
MAEYQCVRNVPASLFISMYADFLKKSGRVELPSWLNIIKTGNNKVNSPENPNWFFYRLAALSRKFYLNRGKGIGNLRKDYGGKKRRGSRPGKRVLSSGKILRLAIQQLEKLNIIYQDDRGKRKITKKAKQDMDKRAEKIISLFA